MSTHDKQLPESENRDTSINKGNKRQNKFFPVRPGVEVRCPYCKETFIWPPNKLRCPQCDKTVRPPYGYSTSDRASSVRKKEKILKEGEKIKRQLGLRYKSKPKMNPALIMLALLVMIILGIALSLSSSDSGERKVVADKRDPYEITTNRMAVYAMALRHFKEDTGRYPEYYGDGGLQALIVNPGIFHWYGPYVSTIKSRDGWKRPFFYETTNGVPRLISAGPDRNFNTEDDIIAPESAYTIDPDFIKRNKARRPTSGQGR